MAEFHPPEGLREVIRAIHPHLCVYGCTSDACADSSYSLPFVAAAAIEAYERHLTTTGRPKGAGHA